MGANLPYMTAPGALPKILNKIIDAAVPESFNGDFLGTKLGFPGGNQKTFISWAKKCGFLDSNGTPTQLYKNFRNPAFKGAAMAEALKKGYAELYVRNEYTHDLSKPDFVKLVSEVVGAAHDNAAVKYIVGSFHNAREFADFDSTQKVIEDKNSVVEKKVDKESPVPTTNPIPRKMALGLNYTINLVLPKTDDPAVYDAIFKTLRENLLDE